MSKRPSTDAPITVDNIRTFIDEQADFGFEMRVLRALREFGLTCEHSGTYSDPVEQKIREFDIRAQIQVANRNIALAIECKNLRPTSALLVSAVGRQPHEAFHDELLVREFTHSQNSVQLARRNGAESIYAVGDMVGKKIDQVSLDSNNQPKGDDRETFGRWLQAVNSTRDLIFKATAPEVNISKERVIVPVLVVPTNSLWQVDYDQAGSITAGPQLIIRSSRFLNHSWQVPMMRGYAGETVGYTLSHLEIVTFGGLHEFVDSWRTHFSR